MQYATDCTINLAKVCETRHSEQLLVSLLRSSTYIRWVALVVASLAAAACVRNVELQSANL